MYIDKRIEWIDVAKGIGILFIILGHVFNTGFLRKWIFSFHVPFFFVVAGFTFSINRGIVDFVIRKAKTLWIPYLFWSCFSIVLYSALVVIIPSFGEPLDFMNSFFVVLYGNSRPDIMKWNTPLWFLPCLFGTNICVYFIELAARNIGGPNKNFRVIIVALSWGLGIIIEKYLNMRLPLQMEEGVFMIGFVESGILFYNSEFRKRVERFATPFLALMLFVLLIIGCWISSINGFAEVRIFSYGKVSILFVLTSLLLGSACILLSFIFENSYVLQRIGKSSLTILVLHKFPVVFFQKICPVTKTLLSKPEEITGILCSVMVTAVIAIICLAADSIISNVCPIIIGNRRNIENKKVNYVKRELGR